MLQLRKSSRYKPGAGTSQAWCPPPPPQKSFLMSGIISLLPWTCPFSTLWVWGPARSLHCIWPGAQLFPLLFSTFFSYFSLLSPVYWRPYFCSVAAQEQGSLLLCPEREAGLSPRIPDSGRTTGEKSIFSY